MDKINPIEKSKGYIALSQSRQMRREIAEMLIQGLSTSEIIERFQEVYGKGYKPAIYYLIDSAPKSIEFVRANRPESTKDEIRKIWLNSPGNKRYNHHFDNL